MSDVEKISAMADSGASDEQITEEIKIKETPEVKEEVKKEKKAPKPKKEKAKKEPKPKKEKPAHNVDGKISVKGIQVGHKVEIDLELTKFNVASISSFREGATIIKLVGGNVRYMVDITKEEFDKLVK